MWLMLATLMWLGVGDGPAQLQEALALEQQGHSAEALAALEKLAAGAPEWEAPRLEAARLHLKLGTGLEVAERLLTEARTLAPQNPRGHYLYGLLKLEQGTLREAMVALELAVRYREDF